MMSLRPAKREPTNTNSDLARGKLANVCTEALKTVKPKAETMYQGPNVKYERAEAKYV